MTFNSTEFDVCFNLILSKGFPEKILFLITNAMWSLLDAVFRCGIVAASIMKFF